MSATSPRGGCAWPSRPSRDGCCTAGNRAAPGPLPPMLGSGSGDAVPVRDLVHGPARLAGFRGRIEEDTGGAAGSARSAGVSWKCSDITTAERALGCSPRRRLDDMPASLWGVDAGAAAHDGTRVP
ncbi:hypothetical protein ACFY7H_14870 [Streptomyces sp. NPDC012794]|uniref:hypothetical protein n=1 Tax=Streptomyces sp. NPDC012794 TaxID=3364850 RepID=UPI0036B35024